VRLDALLAAERYICDALQRPTQSRVARARPAAMTA